jgi:hypothetical protein
MQALRTLLVHLRQSSIESCNTDFETPKNGSVERPSYNLDLRAPDPIVMLYRIWVKVLTLFRRHVAICEAVELGADQVGCHDLRNKKQLLPPRVSISSRQNARGALLSPQVSAYTC